MSRIIFFIALGAACVLAGCSSPARETAKVNSNATPDHTTMGHANMDHGNSGHESMMSSPNASSAPYDLQFLDTMIAHHEGAVHMAKLVEGKAKHAELIRLSQNIVTSQQKEISDMRSWREQWFPGAAPAINMELSGMNNSMKGMDMKKLGSLTMNDFDLEFIKQMTPHHEGALPMAEEAIARSTRPEIKRLANAIIEAQKAEIAQMKRWQIAWQK